MFDGWSEVEANHRSKKKQTFRNRSIDTHMRFSTYIEIEKFQNTFVSYQEEEIMSIWIDHWYPMNFMLNQRNNRGVQTKFKDSRSPPIGMSLLPILGIQFDDVWT